MFKVSLERFETPTPVFFHNDIIPKEFRPMAMQEYHPKEVRSAADKDRRMAVTEAQVGAHLKLDATRCWTKSEHVLFYRTRK
ncbi:MAG: hypothetical protein DMG32_10745 [Acidobacteria bacterium]|nr:MAG: hypothetical protein DMG32_10745 [Acidobacteriota bacterium]